MSIVPGWRWLLGWTAAGCAGVLGHRGDLWQTAAAGGVVLAVLAWRACEEIAATREALREPPQPPPPPPAPRLERVLRPPWDTAAWPVIPAEADSGEAVGRHRKRRGLRDVAGDALRAVAQAYLS